MWRGQAMCEGFGENSTVCFASPSLTKREGGGGGHEPSPQAEREVSSRLPTGSIYETTAAGGPMGLWTEWQDTGCVSALRVAAAVQSTSFLGCGEAKNA